MIDAEAATDQFLGRLLRFHPERAVTPHNPLPEVVVLEPQARPELVAIIPTPTMIERPLPRTPSIRRILVAVARYYEMSVTELIAKRRTANVVLPRQIAMYLARELTTKSLPEIGRIIGNRDHTTIMHGWRKIKELLEDEPHERLADDVALIRLSLLEGS